MVDDETLARAFKALGHPRRARIFRLLAEHPETGRSVTDIQRATGIKDTPLLHHIREMQRGGLIERQRRGPVVAHILTTAPLAHALGEAMRLERIATGPAGRAA